MQMHSKSDDKNEDTEGMLMDKTDIKILNLLQKKYPSGQPPSIHPPLNH